MGEGSRRPTGAGPRGKGPSLKSKKEVKVVSDQSSRASHSFPRVRLTILLDSSDQSCFRLLVEVGERRLGELEVVLSEGEVRDGQRGGLVSSSGGGVLVVLGHGKSGYGSDGRGEEEDVRQVRVGC